MRPGKCVTVCWVCGAPTPGGDDPNPECLDCVIAATGSIAKRTGEKGPWYFQHEGSECVFREDNPFRAFESLIEPTLDEIDEDLYLQRITEGWTAT